MTRPATDRPLDAQDTAPRYHSPLRAAQAAATRELIIRAAVRLIESSPYEGPTAIEVARAAGVRERTLYRHFATRDDLLAAAWARVGERLWEAPDAFTDIAAIPRKSFARMDAQEGLTLAALFSTHGRTARRDAMAVAKTALRYRLAEETAGLPSWRRQDAEAIIRVLSDAWTWMSLREEGLPTPRAAEAASWAIAAILDALRRERGAARAAATAAAEAAVQMRQPRVPPTTRPVVRDMARDIARDMASRDMASRDMASRDMASRDMASRDLGPRDLGREAAIRD
ncbi:TetR/AcrR family transcriptional regulator [Arenibaculum pallidiluteum]|uniref:TetR/AcrR family transcriptional regulator n=1 Tax=Arenibaculum pallidiluteum TaxID=2812559 RepID=UPI001A957BA3|nr:helix-turn-helix domain-containing protein [Arenibaculum pallidiluteum]